MSEKGERTSAESAEGAREITVAPGNYDDVCPLCGIHRQNAGFLRVTCGDDYRKDGCFIVSRASLRSLEGALTRPESLSGLVS